MGCFIAGVRGGAGDSSAAGSAQSVRLHGRSAWAALLMLASGCTLTTDPFDPSIVSPPNGEGTSVESGLLPSVPVPSEGDDPGGEPTPGGSVEGADPGVSLDPSGTGGEQLGGVQSSEGSEGGADAGVAVADGGAGSSSDAGAPPPPPAAPCTGVERESSCYAFFGEPITWVEAEVRCVAWGGQLASVGSSDENAFLNAWPAQLGLPPFTGTGIWLGGTDAANGNDFAWSDATPFGFTAWGQSQPDNGAGVDCIEKRNDGTGLWYDQRCTDQRPYVCERPL